MMAEPGRPPCSSLAMNSQLTGAAGHARVRGRDLLWVTGVWGAAATPHDALWRHVA